MRFRWRLRTSIDLPWVNLSTLIVLWAAAAPFIALWLRDPQILSDGVRSEPLIYAITSAILSVASFIWFRLGHGVSRFFSLADAILIIKASAMAVLCTLIACFLLTRLDNIPRAVPIIHFFVLAGGTILARAERYFRRRRRDRIDVSTAVPENILILGVNDLSWFYIQMIEDLAPDLYTVVGLLDENRSLQGRFVHGYPVAGRIHDIAQVTQEYAIHGVPIHRLVLATDLEALASSLAERVRSVADSKAIPLEVLSDRLGLRRPLKAHNRDQADRFEIPRVRGPFWLSKRVFDFCFALLLLIVTAPIALIVSLVVLLDCGMPIIFWQMRVGRQGERITVYKFRTLRAPYTARGAVRPERERVSAIGHLLRHLHVDELPQLLSILEGEMSFIGPRPLLPLDLSPQASLRLAVRPGISGWAQVNGATLLTVEEKNAMDEWYVRHASWRLEFMIALRTVAALFAKMRRNEAAIQAALAEKGQASGGDS